MRYGLIFILALAGLFVGTACFATTLPHKENAVKHKKTLLKIRVMAEYGSSGIWGFSEKGLGGWRHGMLEHRALKLPKELSDRFDAWIRIYEDQNPEGLLDTEAFNAEGMQLARLLKAFLGPNRHVEYQGEDKEGRLLQAIIIEGSSINSDSVIPAKAGIQRF
ncbi:MAG: hypothetical protein PHQ60_16475 [Sideroxydans sp.]|nr:hypothetical protein [Sideroxydans sp.]